jgi:tRNA (guanosine-2'-O-)-methyltransferase
MATQGSASAQTASLADHLAGYVSDHKRELIERVLSRRTRFVTVVLEDIVQAQNASAVVRTCECLGIQDIHIIENQSWFEVNRKVLKGSYKWITFHRYKKKGADNTAACLIRLKEEGYRIWVTDPDPQAMPLTGNIVPEGRVALVFGNELRGISATALSMADRRARIPMFGFTESFNISVSAAILLSYILPGVRAGNNEWELSEPEKTELRLTWYRRCVRNADLIEKQFLRNVR